MIRSPIDIKNSNIWEKPNQENFSLSNSIKRTIIVIGDNKSGKTSFIKLLRGDFDLETKPTYFIDYFTMKKQGIEIEVYEISSFKYLKTLHFLITPENCSQLMILLCLDLTASENLVNRINEQLQIIKKLCKDIIEEKSIQNINSYNEQRSKNYQFIERNEDIEIIDRMPFKFTIVGCKHDLFEKMKTEEKKWICRCLRYMAHTNESNLIFSSTKNMQTAAELRSIMFDEILGIRNQKYSNQKDHNKAIFILTGEDKISEMSLPAFNNSGAFNEIKILEQQLDSVFPSIKNIELPEEEKIEFNCNGLDPLIKKHKKEIRDLLKTKNIKIDRLADTLNFKKTNNFYQSESSDLIKIKDLDDTTMRLNLKKQKLIKESYLDEDEQNESEEN